MMHQSQSHGKGKGKAKQNQNNNKLKQTTTFKKKKKKNEDESFFVCGSPNHWAKKCPNRKGRKHQTEQKTANMVVSNSGGGTSGYNNLPYVFQCFNLPLGGLILVQMFMCVLMFHCSLLTRLPRILL
jgi:hypothetical protein